MSDQQTDLTAALPSGGSETVIAGGETIIIKPATLGQIAAAMKVGSGLLKAYKAQAGNVDWLLLLSEHSDELLATSAALIGKDVPWMQALQADEALELAIKVLGANVDFFTRILLPKVNIAAGSFAEKVKTAGAMQYSGLSPVGTA